MLYEVCHVTGDQAGKPGIPYQTWIATPIGVPTKKTGIRSRPYKVLFSVMVEAPDGGEAIAEAQRIADDVEDEDVLLDTALVRLAKMRKYRLTGSFEDLTVEELGHVLPRDLPQSLQRRNHHAKKKTC